MARAKTAIPIVYACLTVLCWAFAGSRIDRMTDLWHEGIQVQATVNGLDCDDDNASTRYILIYRFSANGFTIGDQSNVLQSQFDGMSLGDPVLVTYLEKDPDVHVLGRVDQIRVDDLKASWQRLLLVLTFMGVGAYGYLLVSYRKEAKLLRDGQIVETRVVSTDSRGNGGYRKVHFSYAMVPGTSRQGYVRIARAAPFARSVGEVVPFVFKEGHANRGRLIPSLRLAQIAEEPNRAGHETVNT